MPIQITTAFIGEVATTRAVLDLLGRYEARAESAVENAATKATAAAKGNVRRDTDQLHDSIDWVRDDRDGPGARVGTGAPYGRRIEFDFTGPDTLGRTFNHVTLPAAWLGPVVPRVEGWLIEGLRG